MARHSYEKDQDPRHRDDRDDDREQQRYRQGFEPEWRGEPSRREHGERDRDQGQGWRTDEDRARRDQQERLWRGEFDRSREFERGQQGDELPRRDYGRDQRSNRGDYGRHSYGGRYTGDSGAGGPNVYGGSESTGLTGGMGMGFEQTRESWRRRNESGGWGDEGGWGRREQGHGLDLDRGFAGIRGPMGTDRGHHGKGPKGYRRSDERIKEDVSEMLYQDRGVDATDIDVQVQGGDVTLTGTVDSRDAKREAEDCVWNASGVRNVTNMLKVTSEVRAGDGESRTTSDDQQRLRRTQASTTNKMS